MSDYRVKISIRNERLLSAIEAAGYKSSRQFAITNGFSYETLGLLIRGLRKPLDTETGKATKFCKEVLESLGKNLEDCFTDRQLKGFKISSYQVKVDEKELKRLVSPTNNQEHSLLESDLDKKITEVLSTRLTPRQEKVIRMHFGIGADREYTLTEISKHFNVTKSRIGQLVQDSLKKLRHGSSASLLLSTGFYDKFTKVKVDPEEIDMAEIYLQREKSIKVSSEI